MPLQSNRYALLFFFSFIASCLPQTTPSIYDVLTSHGLPMGILPKGVTDYELDSNGRFEAYLDEACNAELESRFHFDRIISGSLGFGKISNLTGIAAQELFLWFPVKGIRVDVPSSGLIYFDVGVVFKQFPIYLFETPPDCLAGTISAHRPERKTIIQTLLKKKQTRDSVLMRKNSMMRENQEKKMSSS